MASSVPYTAAPATGSHRVPAKRALRRAVVALLALILLLGLGWRWFKGSGFVKVSDVTITGTHGADAGPVRSALHQAAASMTTLKFSAAKLDQAVAAYPTVASVSAKASFPHTVTITVRMRAAVAVLHAGGRDIAVAGDGTLLPDAKADGLPAVTVTRAPAGKTVTDGLARAEISILAAAPPALRTHVTRVFTGSRGLAVQLNDGPAVAIGAADRLKAKWLSLAAVLANPSSAGGAIIDLSVPERPVVVPMTNVTPPTAGTGVPSGAAVPPTP